MLYRREITDMVTYDVYQRGVRLYQLGKVGPFQPEEKDRQITVRSTVRGSGAESYRAALFLAYRDADTLGITDYDCSCPAAYTWRGMCKHCVALALAYADRTKAEKRQARQQAAGIRGSSQGMEDVFSRYGKADRNIPAQLLPGQLHVHLLFDLTLDYLTRRMRVTVEMKAGRDKLYVVKSIPQFLHSVLHGSSYDYGKSMKVLHSFDMFDPVSTRILQVLASVVRRSHDIDTTAAFYDTGTQNRILTLDSPHALALMRLAAEAEGKVQLRAHSYAFAEADPQITLQLKEDPEGKGAEMTFPGLLRILPEPDSVYTDGETLYHCTPQFEKNALPFLHALKGTDTLDPCTAFLGEQDYTRFCALVLPRLQEVMKVDTGNVDFTDFLPRKASFRFYLSQQDEDTILLRPEVCYGEASYPLLVTGKEYRNREEEQKPLQICERYFPHPSGQDCRSAVGDEEACALLEGGLDALRELGELFIDDAMRPLRWAGNAGASMGVSLSGNLIDIHVEAEGLSPDEINNILGAYRQKKKFYRLNSGEFLSLSEGGLAVVAELSEGLGFSLDQNGNARTDAFRAQYINAVADREDCGLTVTRNSDFKKQIRALKNYRDSDYELPEGLHANLRSYQRAGYRWLCTLSELGLGGILADDMGLGKTLQVLTYCAWQGGKTLVICPASLLYNWQSECRKFTPAVQTYIVRGNAEQRQEALSQEAGLLITSYEQLRRDEALYRHMVFDCCILDEAQYIRNAATKAAKAVKAVQAKHRFALTGTPVENRLSDLWSIFDFLMPGYLYAYRDFRRSLEQPAVEGDEQASERLKRMTAPFILRRKKQDVLRELPEKVENVLYVEMLPEQRRLYDAQEQALRMTLLKTPDSQLLHQKIQILSALTRLRQLCCTPGLYLEGYTGGAAKVSACIELLKESMDSGHKTLVFSQFTGMLEQLISAAQAEGIPSLYLSGKDSSEKRRDMVQAFQETTVPVFFISLKAGGTGLNLTAADRVIHFDPWWNAAAEDQATDRTHRIGQKNSVLVTKLVCRESIEERILDLQNRKRGLSDMIIDREGLQSASLDREELMFLLNSHEASGTPG